MGKPAPQGRFKVTELGANTNVIGHAGRTLALVESGAAQYGLTDELDTVGVWDFCGTLPGGYSAHPKRDPETGELRAVTYGMERGNTVQYSVIGVDGRARRTVDITVHGSPMMHDYDLPVTFDAALAAEMTMPKPLRLPARLMMSALIGRVRIPDPIMMRQSKPATAEPPLPVPVEPALPGSGWRDAARRWGRRCPLVRGRAVLRVPSDERL